MKKGRGKMLKDVVKRHRSKLHELAQKNTLRDENGLPLSAKNDPWRNDDEEKEQKISEVYYTDSKVLV